jgi:hypothetical protein
MELHRHAALGVLNDRISNEGSGKAEMSRRTKPNKRLHLTGISIPLIVNSDGVVVVSRRVNRGVRWLP